MGIDIKGRREQERYIWRPLFDMLCKFQTAHAQHPDIDQEKAVIIAVQPELFKGFHRLGKDVNLVVGLSQRGLRQY